MSILAEVHKAMILTSITVEAYVRRTLVPPIKLPLANLERFDGPLRAAAHG